MGAKPIQTLVHFAERVYSSNCTVVELVSEILRQHVTLHDRVAPGTVRREWPGLDQFVWTFYRAVLKRWHEPSDAQMDEYLKTTKGEAVGSVQRAFSGTIPSPALEECSGVVRRSEPSLNSR
jgi:hypothetical protein